MKSFQREAEVKNEQFMKSQQKLSEAEYNIEKLKKEEKKKKKRKNLNRL